MHPNKQLFQKDFPYWIRRFNLVCKAETIWWIMLGSMVDWFESEDIRAWKVRPIRSQTIVEVALKGPRCNTFRSFLEAYPEHVVENCAWGQERKNVRRKNLRGMLDFSSFRSCQKRPSTVNIVDHMGKQSEGHSGQHLEVLRQPHTSRGSSFFLFASSHVFMMSVFLRFWVSIPSSSSFSRVIFNFPATQRTSFERRWIFLTISHYFTFHKVDE